MDKLSDAASAEQLNIKRISQAFRDARLAGVSLPAFPGDLPINLDVAYRIQDLSLHFWPETVAGWKVAGMDTTRFSHLGADRLCGPVFAPNLKSMTTDAAVSMPVYPGGFAGVEAEFACCLGDIAKLPAGSLDTDDAMSVIERVHIAIEVAGSPLATINEIGPVAAVSDFGNNAGLVTSIELTSEQIERMHEVEVTVDVDGKRVGASRAKQGRSGPLGAVAFLIENLRSRDVPIPPGTWVTTGAVTGVHAAAIGSTSVARFEGIGSVSVAFVAHGGASSR